MNEFLLFISYLVSGGIFFLLIVIFARLLFSKSAPFIPIPKDALDELLSSVSIKKGDIVYDLGCGDARILLFLNEKYPEAIYKGIELRIFPFLLAKFKTRKKANILIERGDFFKKSLSDATHIVTYLFPDIMDALLPKIKKETKNITVISLDFPFSNVPPKKTIILEKRTGKLGCKSFMYVFE